MGKYRGIFAPGLGMVLPYKDMIPCTSVAHLGGYFWLLNPDEQMLSWRDRPYPTLFALRNLIAAIPVL
jgi:hypothetical protein